MRRQSYSDVDSVLQLSVIEVEIVADTDQLQAITCGSMSSSVE